MSRPSGGRVTARRWPHHWRGPGMLCVHSEYIAARGRRAESDADRGNPPHMNSWNSGSERDVRSGHRRCRNIRYAANQGACMMPHDADIACRAERFWRMFVTAVREQSHVVNSARTESDRLTFRFVNERDFFIVTHVGEVLHLWMTAGPPQCIAGQRQRRDGSVDAPTFMHLRNAGDAICGDLVRQASAGALALGLGTEASATAFLELFLRL